MHFTGRGNPTFLIWHCNWWRFYTSPNKYQSLLRTRMKTSLMTFSNEFINLSIVYSLLSNCCTKLCTKERFILIVFAVCLHVCTGFWSFPSLVYHFSAILQLYYTKYNVKAYFPKMTTISKDRNTHYSVPLKCTGTCLLVNIVYTWLYCCTFCTTMSKNYAYVHM